MWCQEERGSIDEFACMRNTSQQSSSTTRAVPSLQPLLSRSFISYPRFLQIAKPHTIALQQREDVFGRDMKSIDCHNLE